ncbi:MAG: hypothetical protein IIC20_06880 [Chloroflexi bacterium]|nr:hypothetical protein [Chloroflexota bacterium]
MRRKTGRRHSLAKFLPGETITRVHGKARKVDGRIVLPVHHPAAALYQQSLRGTLEEDFRQIPQLLQQMEQVPEPEPKPKQLGLF